LRHVQQRGYAGHEVLAERRGARHDVRVALGQADHQRGVVFRETAVVMRGLNVQDLGDAGEPGCGLGGGTRV
jgi:hypothetical protein